MAEELAVDARPGERWIDALSRREIQELVTHRDVMSWLSIGLNWGLIFGSMALVAAWPNLLTIIVALFVIGARVSPT